jgi:hypothetical protein
MPTRENEAILADEMNVGEVAIVSAGGKVSGTVRSLFADSPFGHEGFKACLCAAILRAAAGRQPEN